jgi:hypothetical protein
MGSELVDMLAEAVYHLSSGDEAQLKSNLANTSRTSVVRNM